MVKMIWICNKEIENIRERSIFMEGKDGCWERLVHTPAEVCHGLKIKILNFELRGVKEERLGLFSGTSSCLIKVLHNAFYMAVAFVAIFQYICSPGRENVGSVKTYSVHSWDNLRILSKQFAGLLKDWLRHQLGNRAKETDYAKSM